MLLLDEPLSALDAKIRVALRHEIREIQRQLGITTVYVTHDQEEALELSDRIVVMSDGRIEQIGTPFEIYNFPATPFVASFVGTLNAIDRRPWSTRRRPPVASAARRSGRHRRSRRAPGDARRGRPAARDDRPSATASHPARNRSPADGRRRRASSARSCASGCASARDVDAQVIDVDTFNNPNLSVPAIGDRGHRRLPAGGVPGPRRCRGAPSAPSRRARRRGGAAVAARPAGADGIELVIFDKDGTLIDFHAMWGGWAETLAERLERT